MCRVCGRVIRCIFDSMPSRIPTAAVGRARHFSTAMRALPPPPRQVTFPLRHGAKLHQAATVRQELSSLPSSSSFDPSLSSSSPPPPPPPPFADPASTTSTTTTTPTTTSTAPSPSGPLIISKSLRALLPALSAQQPHYVTAHIHRLPYLLTAGDTLRLPFHLHGVSPGDVLRLNRASILGSRDYTLKAGLGSHGEAYDGRRLRQPLYVDERLFECRVRVLGVENQPMQIKEKTKRRNRKVKTVRSKHKYTVCRVMDVRVKSLDELMQQEKGVVVLE